MLTVTGFPFINRATIGSDQYHGQRLAHSETQTWIPVLEVEYLAIATTSLKQPMDGLKHAPKDILEKSHQSKNMV